MANAVPADEQEKLKTLDLVFAKNLGISISPILPLEVDSSNDVRLHDAQSETKEHEANAHGRSTTSNSVFSRGGLIACALILLFLVALAGTVYVTEGLVPLVKHAKLLLVALGLPN
jgi:hypothetical protein